VANRPGAGSTFAFYLPAGQSRESIDADSLTPWRGRGTVLIIDDEDTVRSVARKVLEVFGLQVIEATSGTRGLELLRRHLDEIRLVMLDVVLPDLDGAKALRKIGAIRNDLPVILMSGYPEPPAQAVAGGPVSVSFLPKPFDAPTLLALVQKVVPGNQLPSGNEVL
jgi:CheY-like chemotaxis protein